MASSVSHDEMANAIRALAMDAVEAAKSGHPGLPMGMADVATVLFSKILKFDAADPFWPDHDRFVLSAGHGSMLLYALLYLTGYESMTIEDIKNFRQLGYHTPGHPEAHHTKGVEATTGPLGQGVAMSVGMALAERMLAAEFGDIVDHHTYVICSDGDLMEGISQEAIAIAGHLKLSKLIFLWDDNNITIDGPRSIADSVDQIERFKAAEWNAVRVDGQNADDVLAAIETARKADRPSMIACRTTIGYGAPKKAGTNKAHGEALGAEEIAGARKNLHWEAPPFVIPDPILAAWREVGSKGQAAHTAWTEKLATLAPGKRAEFERRIAGELPAGLDAAVREYKKKLVAEKPEIATRKASEAALKVLAPAVPELITGSADLTPSNNTKVEATKDITPGDYIGRYVHWGIREHGMAAACNGMALHGGFIPSGATFLIFTDYCRPSLRLAALMGVRVVHAMTHDSIGLGEDGPTHQPIEQLSSLRAIPNMNVFRPADSVETLECWQLGLQNQSTPSILALTRQNLPAIRLADSDENLCARGAYEVAGSDGKAAATIFASGSEVSLALDARKLLAEKNVLARVVSVPCMELFQAQDESYRKSVIGDAPIRVGVEAAVRQSWDWLIGLEGIFIGMSTFGDSGPYKKLYEHFGITPSAVAEAVLKRHNSG